MAYLSLSTANLPDPAIDPAQDASPEDYFGIDTYTGTGTTHERSALQFQPDFVWIKGRNNTTNHVLSDSIRGATKVLESDSTAAEYTDATSITSFDSDGFTLGASNDVNNGTAGYNSYVAWNWKAGGTAVSNTDGSITSTVSANTTSGFSIVKLSDPNNGASYNVGHGLNSPPEMFFIKKTNTTSDWSVYHKDVGNDRRLVLNSTDGQSGSSSVYFGSTTPTSTVVTIGSGLSTGDNWIMYCFHSVDGFSKCGSYVGNGSTDGPFIYTGFRPSFILTKRTDSTGSWRILDNKRSGYNSDNDILIPNLSDSEYDGASNTNADILSNGFKLRTTSSSANASGSTQIYMAFAENPFRYATAR